MTEISILQDWLPTKLSQRIALWTWPVAIGGAALVRFLIPLTPSVTAAEIVLLQSIVFLFLALLGSLITLFLVMHHYKNPLSREEKIKQVERLAEQAGIDPRVLLGNLKSDQPQSFPMSTLPVNHPIRKKRGW